MAHWNHITSHFNVDSVRMNGSVSGSGSGSGSVSGSGSGSGSDSGSSSGTNQIMVRPVKLKQKFLHPGCLYIKCTLRNYLNLSSTLAQGNRLFLLTFKRSVIVEHLWVTG